MGQTQRFITVSDCPRRVNQFYTLTLAQGCIASNKADCCIAITWYARAFETSFRMDYSS